ncbi:cupin domain-containing protein [Myxacorys almedinensis]|uniref:Cupin domain-containing protein n=1 Tax=Myxacorys almedinensis A TaxID=2690445 RepID=A0A8J7Z2Z0_9CYAN|nr:cupin domain-containing protein [Myxacorys almedinensis]NDJ18759.1 cupin domain-containing protein [Myxacorys almedinensis A]
MNNLFDLPAQGSATEIVESLVKGNHVLVERIISIGHTTPAGEWYDQPHDEWVVLLQGEAQLEDETGKAIALYAGDYCLILAHQKHRVAYTSTEPPCIWLAIHGALSIA